MTIPGASASIRVSMRSSLRAFAPLLFALFLPSAGMAGWFDLSDEDGADQVLLNKLSSRWLADARMALPEKYFISGGLSFAQITNLLCHENNLGNNAAKGLWGCVLVVQNQSSEEAGAGMNLLRDSAGHGDVPSMLNLGLICEGDKFGPRNYSEAVHWFSRAAAQGNAEGEQQLGGCYHYGLGTNQDFAMAAKYYRLAAAQSNSAAMKSLGYLLLNGYGVPKDRIEAAKWLTRSATEGTNRRAMYNLGVITATNALNKTTMAQAFQWYKQSAELGDPLACMALANCYNAGWGVESDMQKFHEWRLKGAILGSTEAEFKMGAAYRDGEGVPKNMESALLWSRKAAVKHHPWALYNLALYFREDKTNAASQKLSHDYMLWSAQADCRAAQFFYAVWCFSGALGGQDCETGNQWLRKAAENGWPPAEFYLFQLYENGYAPEKGCPTYPKDQAEGLKWIHRAADHGDLHAESVLAVMLINGNEIPPNKSQAEALLRHAAGMGFADAQNDLGYSILAGDLGTADLVEAAKWCQVAVANGTNSTSLPRFKVNLSNALARLTEEQRAEVNRQVKDFHPLKAVGFSPLAAGWGNNPQYKQEGEKFGH